MTNCSKIAQNLILSDCSPVTTGVEKSIVLINYEDIDRTASQVNGNVCSELVLKTSKKGFKYSSEKNSWEVSSPLNRGTYKNRFDHNILGRVFVKTQEVKDELIKLMSSKVVAVVENLDQSTPETHFEILGYESGLVLTDLQHTSTDADGVMFSFNLASDNNAKESQLPLSFFKTSIETTRAAIESLVDAA